MLARQQLLFGQPFGEVSGQCGSSDYSNFPRAFRKHVGMRPGPMASRPAGGHEPPRIAFRFFLDKSTMYRV